MGRGRPRKINSEVSSNINNENIDELIDTNSKSKRTFEQICAEINNICNLKTPFHCEKCNDKGYIQEKDSLIVKFCNCTNKLIKSNAYLKAGIPPEYHNMTIDNNWNIKQDAYGEDLGPCQSIKEEIGKFMKQYITVLPALCDPEVNFTFRVPNKPSIKKKSLLLIGGPKSGKSFLAAIAVKHMIDRNLLSKMYSWSELIYIISDYENKEEFEEILYNFANYDLIVIDGVTNELPWNNSKLGSFNLSLLSTKRLSTGKPTIITMQNKNFNEISNYSESWARLLNSCIPIKLPSVKRD